METYLEMKARHEKEVNAFPFMFAFSNKQFEEGCKKLGVTDPKAELFALRGTGGFYRKTDAARLHEMTKRHNDEMDAAMLNEEFAVNAYCYEASNHEYQINLDPEFDMANCFGYPFDRVNDRIAWEKVPNGETLARYYAKGIKKHMDWVREHDAW